MPSPHQLNRVGYHFTTHQGSLHSLCPHGNPIANCDRIELHRRSTGGANALFNSCCQVTQVEVTRHGFNPSIGNADYGAHQIFFGKADAFQIGSCRGAIPPFQNDTTRVLGMSCHQLPPA